MAASFPVVIASDQSAVPVSQATASSLNAQVVGELAHDSADSGKPIKIGGYADNSIPTGVTPGDRVNGWFGLSGQQMVSMVASAGAGVDANTQAYLLDSTDVARTSAFGAAGYVFNGTTWDRLRGSATDGVLVNLGTNNDVTVTGSVTANAGTNLNTSALLTSADFAAAFGTAGTADAQVMSVQGIASMTPVQVSQATASSLNATVVGTGTFVVQENGAALTSLQLLDNAVSGAGFNITQFNGEAIDVGAGTETAAIRVTLPTNGTGVVGLNAGTNNIGDVDVLTIPGIVGTIADDATTPGAPVMTGGSAKNFDGTTPGEVSAEDDVTRFITDRNRRQYVNTVHPQFWSYHLDTSTAQTDTTLAADPGDNYAVFITDIVFSSGAGTAINIFFEEGATKILGPYYLEAVAGRGLALHFTTPKMVTASTAVTYTTSASIAQAIDVTGFVARVT